MTEQSDRCATCGRYTDQQTGWCARCDRHEAAQWTPYRAGYEDDPDVMSIALFPAWPRWVGVPWRSHAPRADRQAESRTGGERGR